MTKITNKNNLSQQYLTDEKLEIRAKLHQLYNVNKQPIEDWFFSNLEMSNSPRILEIGCGNGNLWNKYLEKLSVKSELFLTDFSSGMVDIVQSKYGKDSRVTTCVADVESLPFETDSFDIIIANHTLHHVKNIDQAINEINRVLISKGKFYATTNGSNGLENYLYKAIQNVDAGNKSFAEPLPFNLQNANSFLTKRFSKCTIIEFPNTLEVTRVQDLILWIDSTRNMQPEITNDLLEKLTIYFENLIEKQGKIKIPKQVGLVVGTNS